jgi:hypothetical protein
VLALWEQIIIKWGTHVLGPLRTQPVLLLILCHILKRRRFHVRVLATWCFHPLATRIMSPINLIAVQPHRRCFVIATWHGLWRNIVQLFSTIHTHFPDSVKLNSFIDLWISFSLNCYLQSLFTFSTGQMSFLFVGSFFAHIYITSIINIFSQSLG